MVYDCHLVAICCYDEVEWMGWDLRQQVIPVSLL